MNVLLLSARAELTDAQTERLRGLLKDDFDWDYFYRLARRHSLVPLVFRQLDMSLKDSVPAQVLQRFQHDYRQNAARNVVLTNELTSLTDAVADRQRPFNGASVARAPLFLLRASAVASVAPGVVE